MTAEINSQLHSCNTQSQPLSSKNQPQIRIWLPNLTLNLTLTLTLILNTEPCTLPQDLMNQPPKNEISPNNPWNQPRDHINQPPKSAPNPHMTFEPLRFGVSGAHKALNP
jgi:hypothetical protein